jgi:hypothetical protein
MKPATRSALAVVASIALAACGGSPSEPSGGGGGGGGTATASSKGVVSALGSVTVNGIRFDTSAARIAIDDSPGRPESELKLGMVVKVKGSKDDAAGTGRATEVEAHHAVRGKVDGKGGGILEVGGHQVEIEHGTEFEDRAGRLDSIGVGERVRVHGHPTATGRFRATRVEKDAGTSDDFQVKGFVSDLDRTALTFTLKVSPDAASAYAVAMAPGATLPAGLANGSYVEVHAAAPPAGGALTAIAVHLEDAKLGEAQSEVEVEGLVTSGTSAQFLVEGQTVVTTAATRWENGVPADLLPGVKVEAEGRLDAGNALQATKVSFRANVRLQGAVSNVDAAGGTFQVLGLTVRTDPWTEWKGSGGGSLDLGSIGAGPVEVRGIPASDGSIAAARVESTGDGRLILQGPVSARSASAGTLSILGLTVQTSGQTEYRDVSDAAMTAAAFFAAVTEGRTVVKARSRDPLSGTTLTAEQVEVEGSR